MTEQFTRVAFINGQRVREGSSHGANASEPAIDLQDGEGFLDKVVTSGGGRLAFAPPPPPRSRQATMVQGSATTPLLHQLACVHARLRALATGVVASC